MTVIWSGITEEGAIVPVQVDESGKVIATSSVADEYVLKSGDTMTGPLVLPGDPVENLQAATKNYVDSSASNFVSPKAWAAVQASGVLLSGFNVARVSSGSPGVYIIAFQNPLNNPDYAITINPKSSSRIVGLDAIDNTGFVASVVSRTTGEPAQNSFYFAVYGSDEFYSLSKAESL